MPFQKGVSGNPSGRPAGSINRKWANVGYWFDIIEANMNKLTEREKIKVAQWAMTILIDKTKSIENPEESKQNVESTLEMLKQMENRPAK